MAWRIKEKASEYSFNDVIDREEDLARKGKKGDEAKTEDTRP